jgi:hypothetical protein
MHNLKIEFKGKELYLPTSASKEFEVKRYKTRIQEFLVSPQSGDIGSVITITGELHYYAGGWDFWEHLNNQPVGIYFDTAHIATVTTAPTGKAKFSSTYEIPGNTLRGLHEIKAIYSGDAIHAPCSKAATFMIPFGKNLAINPSQFLPYGPANFAEISYELMVPAIIKIRIYQRPDENNEILVKEIEVFYPPENFIPGIYKTNWLGFIDQNIPYPILMAPAGNYSLKLLIKPLQEELKGEQELGPIYFTVRDM